MNRKDQIRNAYKVTGNSASFYDGICINRADILLRHMRRREALRNAWKGCIQK